MYKGGSSQIFLGTGTSKKETETVLVHYPG